MCVRVFFQWQILISTNVNLFYVKTNSAHAHDPLNDEKKDGL